MADPADDLDEIGKQLQAAGVTGPDHVGNENLGELKPTDPMSEYIRGLEDQLGAATQQEGKNLLDQGVTIDEKTITQDIEPDHGLDQ